MKRNRPIQDSGLEMEILLTFHPVSQPDVEKKAKRRDGVGEKTPASMAGSVEASLARKRYHNCSNLNIVWWAMFLDLWMKSVGL
ncbi:hypothetical protein OIU85_023962 [Salix viminalis]|uniref:Uncharacterized protein n=1 Tax=Salix viminalis TaxID=40686 RepID=A0A9Q0TZR6_SALVM|nr:hypothetical protein OIU85_023962 [Salix viminalis]